MIDTIPILTGDKVKLRPFNDDKDYEAWYHVSQDPNMHLWVGNTIPKNRQEVKALIDIYLETFYIIWMMEDINTNHVIGMMRISNFEASEEGIKAGDSQRLHSNYWRKGYMKEARRLVYNYVFHTLHVDLLCADVWEGNINSSKSLEHAGYRLIDTKQEYFKKYDRMQNKLYYQLKSNGWCQ